MSTRIAAAGRPSSPRLFLVAALLFLPAAAHAANYWVGNNGNPPCTHSNLQDAITTAVGSAGDDVIYLVGPGPFTGPFIVLGGGFRIQGNVGSCGSTTSVGYSTLRAASGSRPLAILMGGAETVRLQRIVVTTDHGSYNGDGGGIWFAGASNDSVLELVDTQVVSNTATGEGGGVYVSGGKLVVGLLTLVGDNAAAANGGGIAARNGALVEVFSWVLGNTALFDGGGVFAPDASVTVRSAATVASVSDNIAGVDGGGLYLGTETDHVITAASSAAPVTISGNWAQRGGGLFVAGGVVALEYASLDHNQAVGEGGGAYLSDGGALYSNAFEAPRPTLGGFPRVEANTAGEGAAFYVADHGFLSLGSGRIRDHHADAGGAVLAVAVGNGALTLHGVAVESNQVPALFGVEDAATLFLNHVSFSGNTLGGFVRSRGGASLVSALAIALDESEPFFLSVESSSRPPEFFCVVTRFAAPFVNLPPGTRMIDLFVVDPQFVAPPGNLHLRYTSPAIDRCVTQSTRDLDGDAFVYDDPYHPGDPSFLADAGADEATVLFVDGYESNGLGQWNGGHSP